MYLLSISFGKSKKEMNLTTSNISPCRCDLEKSRHGSCVLIIDKCILN